MSWRTRKRGTARQVGKKFPIREKRKLPKLLVSRLSRLATKKVELVPMSKLYPREGKPVDLDRRAKYFVKLIKEKYPVAPILVQETSKGYMIIDGHARYEAFKRLGSKAMQANVVHSSKRKLKVLN